MWNDLIRCLDTVSPFCFIVGIRVEEEKCDRRLHYIRIRTFKRSHDTAFFPLLDPFTLLVSGDRETQVILSIVLHLFLFFFWKICSAYLRLRRWALFILLKAIEQVYVERKYF